jgi:hypothetical protein
MPSYSEEEIFVFRKSIYSDAKIKKLANSAIIQSNVSIKKIGISNTILSDAKIIIFASE